MKPVRDEDLARRIDIGVRLGIAEALEAHKKAGRSIAVWEKGHVVWIPAEEIDVDEVEVPPDLIPP